MSGNDIRGTFLKFFGDRGHRVVRSSSLVPVNDPTLLFTNAGMNQFKDVFLGLEQRDYTRATTSQKCVRAGGKHNDLENVGFTNRHHTFFEMLGNFSFGDYFKKDAVAYAWELITSPQWFGIPVDKLTFTVFGGAEIAPGKLLGIDEEARELWVAAGAPRDRVIPVPGLKENFWAMGDTGPCGPCSEIHYDMGPAASDKGHIDCKFGCECGRYVEIWNLVFMQFNRDDSGTVAPLPKPSIDTGAGLERLAAVLQGKISNFDTDLFVPLIHRAGELTGTRPGTSARSDASLRIIADHARASTFLISDGVMPSNEGRGYVLRKIIRRAIRHGRSLGATKPFLSEMVTSVRDLMGDAYPELAEAAPRVAMVLLAEERRFERVLAAGIKHWDEVVEREFAAHVRELLLESARADAPSVYEQLLSKIDDIPPAVLAGFIKADVKPLSTTLSETFGAQKAQILARGVLRGSSDKPFAFPGATAFALYETYGLPFDLMQEAARDLLLDFDVAGFEKAMAEQRVKARASWKGAHKGVANPVYGKLAERYRTEPDFYFGTNAKNRRIEAIVTKDGAVNELPAGAEGEIVLDRTVFYAESGGQVSDIGTLWNNEHTMQIADVRGAYYPVSGLIAHRVVAKEKLVVGDLVAGDADGARREHIKRNHTATHLMHAALRNILGTHVKQAGSLVEPSRLRFDFSHFAAIDAAELRDIEQQVNDEILLNSEIQTNVTTIDDALASGALAFFGDRYPEQNVRVVTIPDPAAPRGFYSKELCGGTHVMRTGDIGLFKIAVEQSAAAGVRRIEAITGSAALSDYQRARQLLGEIAARLSAPEDQLAAAIERIEQEQHQLEKQLETLKRKGAMSKLGDLAEQARLIKGVKVISAELEGVDRETMRQVVDSLRQKLGSGVVVLGTIEDGKVALLAGVTKDLTSKLHAGKIIQATAKLVGGSGGGRPDLAEAGGKDTTGLKMALDQVYLLIDQSL
ncbi:MAG: alanine--tRNA ligase [Acidobacteriia bacterium]|nr:alanine--tRNA ligase [Terriglobia bacterium]